VTYFVGVDIGGTFTDCVVLDESGAARLYKTPTTPAEAAVGVNAALALAERDLGLDEGALLDQVHYLGLGTTVATNALIERKGVKTGIITTRGFRDAVLMQRGMGSWTGLDADEVVHYAQRKLPDPIVPRTRIEEVTERIDQKGHVVTALDEDDVRRAVEALVAQGVEAIAVCLLWSFREPAHERRVAEIIRETAPEVYLSLSSELAPVLGEYERTATTAMNAYLGPLVRDYMSDLAASWHRRGFKGRFRVLDSGGGVITPEHCGQTPVSVLTSGPTGGVLASARLAERLGIPNVLTTDMGGTSFDVGMIVDHEPMVTPLQQVQGYHILKPAVQVTAIGAGGGSIARVAHGQLLVGPSSAGSVPGPVCFGRGGTEPTVTDADVVLGVIDPDYFVGGTFALDKDAAERAVHDRVAKPLGISVAEAAAGIKSIADHRMADLLETLTVGRGHDPRDFAIFAYGGNGGCHCHAFGAELGAQKIIVPSTAPVHSAYGAVMSDLHITTELSDPMRSASWREAARIFDVDRINANFRRLEEQARDALIESGAEAERITVQRSAEIRFRMQVHGLHVPVAAGDLGQDGLTELLEGFRRQFAELYGSEAVFLGAGVEIVSFRVQGRGEIDKPRLSHVAADRSGLTDAPRSRSIHLGGDWGTVTADVVRAGALRPDDKVTGPTVIEHPNTTVFVGPGQTAVLDDLENIVITVDAKESRA
jgi:N-methylhydantoinase A